MKKLMILMLAVAAGLAVRAQDREQFKSRYERQVGSVGSSGVGVEFILDQWAEAFPGDCDMLEGRFAYYYDKSRSEEVKPRPGRKFLGRKPVLTLKDSLGADVNYFTVPVFDDSLFRLSQECIDLAVSLEPAELSHRFHKISSLADYELESPDMAATAVLDLIDYTRSAKPSWLLFGKPLEEGEFESAMQEYCYLFFNKGSGSSYESFRIISEKLAKLYPKNPLFQNNLGAYWQVCKGNERKAEKYYRKALKLDPEDAAAKSNLSIIERNKIKKKK